MYRCLVNEIYHTVVYTLLSIHYVHDSQSVEIVPVPFLVLFRPGTMLVRFGRGTLFILEAEHAKHFLCSSETA